MRNWDVPMLALIAQTSMPIDPVLAISRRSYIEIQGRWASFLSKG
jgi:hypothetical protein